MHLDGDELTPQRCIGLPDQWGALVHAMGTNPDRDCPVGAEGLRRDQVILLCAIMQPPGVPPAYIFVDYPAPEAIAHAKQSLREGEPVPGWRPGDLHHLCNRVHAASFP